MAWPPPKAHTYPSASPIRKSSHMCSPSLTPGGWTHVAADATARKDGKVHRPGGALGFNSGSLT